MFCLEWVRLTLKRMRYTGKLTIIMAVSMTIGVLLLLFFGNFAVRIRNVLNMYYGSEDDNEMWVSKAGEQISKNEEFLFWDGIDEIGYLYETGFEVELPGETEKFSVLLIGNSSSVLQKETIGNGYEQLINELSNGIVVSDREMYRFQENPVGKEAVLHTRGGDISIPVVAASDWFEWCIPASCKKVFYMDDRLLQEIPDCVDTVFLRTGSLEELCFIYDKLESDYRLDANRSGAERILVLSNTAKSILFCVGFCILLFSCTCMANIMSVKMNSEIQRMTLYRVSGFSRRQVRALYLLEIGLIWGVSCVASVGIFSLSMFFLWKNCNDYWLLPKGFFCISVMSLCVCIMISLLVILCFSFFVIKKSEKMDVIPGLKCE